MRQLRRRPEHLRKGGLNADLWPRLVREANGERGLFGVPIFLVGSALLDCNARPRDWDIRLRLSDADFARRFGDPGAWLEQGRTGQWTEVRWRWSDECVKRSKWWSSVLLQNVDFQVYPVAMWKAFDYRPRLRLDTREDAS